MAMLNGTLQLHDVADAEAAIQNIIEDYLRQRRAYLREHDREELASYLLMVAWELSTTHDKSRGWSFSKRLYHVGSLRITDWYRGRFHDLRSPKPALALSLDAPAGPDTPDGPSPSLVETLADQASPSDLATDLDSARLVGWLRHHRDRGQTPPDPWLGRSQMAELQTLLKQPDPAPRRPIGDHRG
jgi:hypothetical protein